MEEIFVGEADAVFEFGLIGPSEFGGFAHIEELTWGAVRTGGVPFDFAFKTNDFGHQFGESLDGDLLACAGIHGLIARVVVHEEHAEIGKVIDIEELAKWRAIAPAGDFLEACLFGFVESTDEGREHMGVLGMLVVVGAIEVGGHH